MPIEYEYKVGNKKYAVNQSDMDALGIDAYYDYYPRAQFKMTNDAGDERYVSSGLYKQAVKQGYKLVEFGEPDAPVVETAQADTTQADTIKTEPITTDDYTMSRSEIDKMADVGEQKKDMFTMQSPSAMAPIYIPTGQVYKQPENPADWDVETPSYKSLSQGVEERKQSAMAQANDAKKAQEAMGMPTDVQAPYRAEYKPMDWNQMGEQTQAQPLSPIQPDVQSGIPTIMGAEQQEHAGLEKRRALDKEEDAKVDETYKAREIESATDVYANYRDRFALTEEGKKANKEINDVQSALVDKYSEEFKQTPEYKAIMDTYDGTEASLANVNKAINDAFLEMYADKINNEMTPYMEEYQNRINTRYSDRIRKDMEEVARKENEGTVSKLMDEIDTISQNLNEDYGVDDKKFFRWSEDERKRFAMRDNDRQTLRQAKELLEDSRNVIEEANKHKDSGFITGVGRGVRDNLQLRDFTFGISDLVDEKRLTNIVERINKGEKVSKAEEKLVEASAANMVTHAYYDEMLSSGYKAGQVTAESLPFMLEFVANPIAGSGKALAKGLLKYALKKWGGKGINAVTKFGTRLGADALAAGGMTLTSGLPGVEAEAARMMRENYDYGVRDGEVYSEMRPETISREEARGKAFAQRFFENQSEMVFNALGGLGKVLGRTKAGKTITGSDMVQGLINSKGGQFMNDLINNPTIQEVASRTQFHGLPVEYLEEVYNNGVNVLMGNITAEEFTDLDKNIETFLGLVPTSVAFGLIGGGGMVLDRAKNSIEMNRIRNNVLTEKERDMFDAAMAAQSEDAESMKRFLKTMLMDKNISADKKKAALELTYKTLTGLAEQEAEELISQGTIQPPTTPTSEGEQARESGATPSEAGKGVRSASTGLMAIEGGDRVKATIDNMVAQPTMSAEEVNEFFNGLPQDMQAPAQSYYQAMQAKQGAHDAVVGRVNEEADAYDATIDQYARPDENGVPMVTTAVHGGATWFVTANDGTHATLYNNKGEQKMVLSKELENVSSLNADEIKANNRQTALSTAEEEFNFSSEHHEKTQMPTQGLTLMNGNETFLVTGVEGDVVTYVPAQVNKEGVLEPKRTSPMQMSVSEALRMQDEFYDASDVAQAVGGNAVASAEIERAAEEAVEGNVTNEEASQQAQQAQQAQQPSAPQNLEPIPTEEKNGKVVPQYHRVPVERTMEDLHDGTLEADEVAQFIEANIAEAQSEVAEIEQRKPTMTTDKASYVQSKQAWQAELNDAQSRVSYWNEVKNAEAQAQEQTQARTAEAQTEQTTVTPMTAQEIEAQVAAENPTMTEEEVKEEARRRPLRDVVGMWEKILGIKINMIERREDVTTKSAAQALDDEASGKSKGRTAGWMAGGQAYIYMPNALSAKDIEETIFHEVIGHKGLKALLGEKFDALCDLVWNGMTTADRVKYLSYIKWDGKSKPTTKQMRMAADEYMAHIAEKIQFNQELNTEERSLWDKIVQFVLDVLNLNLEKYGFRLSETQVEALIVSSFAEMKRNADMGVTESAESAESVESAESSESSQEEGDAMNRREMFSRKDGYTDEIKAIKEEAIKNGTWMKAPNGKATNLNEKQWVQVRTKAFKKWFGDWEKAFRIEKLRKSEVLKVEWNNPYELNRDSAKRWMKDNLRKEYRNSDTGEKIVISKVGINEVTAHGSQDEAHLKSLSAIPEMLEQSIFIEEMPNSKNHDKYDSYRYYVCGLKIDGVDYTAKIVIGVKDGIKYYDHRLTKIEKGTLIDNLNGLSNSVAENQNASISMGKDTKLLSLLQVNSSKVVDANGEPMVMYHGTASDITSFDMYDGSLGKGAYFTSSWDEAAEYAMEKQGVDNIDELDESKVMEVFLNVRDEKNITHSRFSREDIEVLATSPTQIKSATENNGDFSGENNDIRFRSVSEELRETTEETPDGDIRFSIKTADTWVDNLGNEHKGTIDLVLDRMKKMGYKKKDIKAMEEKMRTAVEYMNKLAEMTDENGNVRFAEFNEWAKKTPLYKQVGRHYVKAITSLVSNGDYPINLELTTDCIKREAYTKLLNLLIKRGVTLNHMGPAEIVTIQKVMKQYGIEVACNLCFVEGKRLGIVNWASRIVEDWNNALLEAGVETDEYFDFGKDSETFIPSEGWRLHENMGDVKKVHELVEDVFLLFNNIDPKKWHKQKDANKKAVKAYKKEKAEAWAKKAKKPASEWKPTEEQKKEIQEMLTEGLAPTYINENAEEYRNAFEKMRMDWLEKHPNSDPLSFSPTKAQWGELNKLRNRQIDTVRQKMVRLIMEHPEMRKKMQMGDLLGSNGLMEIRQQHGEAYAELYSIILQRFGTGTPKPVQDAVPYDGEVLTLSDAAYKNANKIGGARLFSFSDFDITKVFDYMQMFFDLEAMKQKLQAYTKEVGAVIAFGKSGAKFNISTLANAEVPDLVKEQYKKASEKEKQALRHQYAENAGLKMGEGGKIDGINFSEEHSVSPEFAEHIFHDKERNMNCGAIMVGASVNHAIYSASTDWIRMVIPFHLSGMPIAAREKTDVLWYTDNTPYQSTRKRTKDGWSKISSSEDTFSFYDDMDKKGWNMRDKTREYLAWCKGNGYRPKFDWGINSDHYRAYCVENGYEPNQEIIDIMDADTTDGVWNQYYKFLTDFTAYQPVFNENGEMVDEIPAPQKNVVANFDFSDVEKEVLFEGENSMLAHREDNIQHTNENLEEIADRVTPYLLGDVEEEDLAIEEGVFYDSSTDAKRWLDAQDEEGGVSFRRVEDKKLIDELEASPKRTGYRNVVLNEDGTFEPPMGNKLRGNGKTVKNSSFRLNEWEEAEEHPELVDENGKITLVKPNGKTVADVNYNPYIHNRLDKVNAQFKEAWSRPNLVYVETEVAETDLATGYRAEKSNLPVGVHSWSNGDLMLSRYDKPVRIVPWEEVADDWEARFKESGVHFDIVPPGLRDILVERGVEILPPHKGMGKKCKEAYREWKENNDEQVMFSRKQKTAPKTVSVQDEHHQTVILSADGAKILKDLDEAIESYRNDKVTKEKTFIGKVAEILNAKTDGSNSQYATFETVNGNVVTIRLANHNATVSTFDNHDEKEGISIVVTPKENKKITNDGDAHVVEFFYDSIKLRRADNKPLAEILKSIKQALYSGEYKDTTGLAESEEVNEENATFRRVDPVDDAFRQQWDALIASRVFLHTETMVDYLNAVKEFQRLIAERNGIEVMDFEDAYSALIAKTSKDRVEMEAFDRDVLQPLQASIRKLVGNVGKKMDWSKGALRELEVYIKCKHAIERNRDMAVREAIGESNMSESAKRIAIKDWENRSLSIMQQPLDWNDKRTRLDALALTYGADLKKDYGGISLIPELNRNNHDWLTNAVDYVNVYEQDNDANDVNALWTSIRIMNDYTLEKQRKTGLVSGEYVNNQRNRYEYYVPLRGFHEDIAEDVYGYTEGNQSGNGSPIKRAEGRTSEAGNPFAAMITMAYTSISAGNKNLAKQRLYNLVTNNNTGGLVQTGQTYMVSIDEFNNNRNIFNGPKSIPKNVKWVEAKPVIPSDASAEKVETIMEDFNNLISELEANGKAKKIGHKSALSYMPLHDQQNEHETSVFFGGNKYTMTIIGNPRLMQSVNGLLNPDSGHSAYKMFKNIMTSAYTSKNVFFATSNLAKDALYANNQAFIRYGAEYWAKFTKNQELAVGGMIRMLSYLSKYRKGELDMNNPLEKMFKEFMDNGSATGYTFIQDQDAYTDDLLDALKKLDKAGEEKMSVAKIWNSVFEGVEYIGNAAELCTRFAAYRTSREMGASVTRAVADAKEITVNFNRKGAGNKTANINANTPLDVRAMASLSQFGRDYLFFWNASVQATYRKIVNMKEHPAKTVTTAMMVPAFAGGLVVPMLNAVINALLGDDDEEDYYDLPDHVRQNNICIKRFFGKGWIKIPLSPDFAPHYGMGDIIAQHVLGIRNIEAKDVLGFALDVCYPMDVNLNSARTVVFTFIPSVLLPVFNHMFNTNFYGGKVYKEPLNAMQANKPEYLQVYGNGSRTCVEISKLCNRLAGGDNVIRGYGALANVNPGIMYNYINGILGGYGTTTLSILDGIINASTGEDLDVSIQQLPLVGRFFVSGDQDSKMKRVNGQYYKEVKNFMDGEKQRINDVKKAYKKGDVDDAYVDEFGEREEVQIYRSMSTLVGYINKLERERDKHPESEEKIDSLLYEYKKQAIEQMREVRKNGVGRDE